MIAVVAVGYNRIESTKRLLQSICDAIYDEQVFLIVSIDKSDCQNDLVQVAKECGWPQQYLRIIAHQDRLKLKNHILSCGDLTKEYEAVIVLEDDIVVGKYYTQYARACIERFSGEEKIAGISLYSHTVNVEVNRPFIPFDNGEPVYLMQFPQSWGQCWTSAMWEDFISWYQTHDDSVFNNPNVPENVKSWGDQSWLKYQVAYCALNNKYYVYPYKSQTTNCSDVGTHNAIACNSSYQVPLGNEVIQLNERSLCDYIRYDAFFEREGAFIQAHDLGLSYGNICIDLYGFKRDFSKYDYLISTKKHNYRIIKQISLSFRPHEVNLAMPILGRGIFIYDLSKVERNLVKQSTIDEALYSYDLKDYRYASLVQHSLHGATQYANILWRIAIKKALKLCSFKKTNNK